MKRVAWNVLSFIPVAACALILACGDDSSSTSPQEDVSASSSSIAGISGLSSDALQSSSAGNDLSSAETELSSTVIESSSAAAVPTQLCKISYVTETGYPNIAVTTAFSWICAPLENCDTSAVNTGYSQCYEGRATVDGCMSSIKAEVVESCGENLEPACETPNGPVYMNGGRKADCSKILR